MLKAISKSLKKSNPAEMQKGKDRSNKKTTSSRMDCFFDPDGFIFKTSLPYYIISR